MYGHNISAMKNSPRMITSKLTNMVDVALKPNQVANPVMVSRRTLDHHKPAGSLSSLTKESLSLTI